MYFAPMGIDSSHLDLGKQVQKMVLLFYVELLLENYIPDIVKRYN